MIKVSVVVPVVGPGPQLERCVDSLLAQRLPAGEYEVVLVDSTPGGAATARLGAASEGRLRVHRRADRSGGIGAARNVGVSQARGEYVLFVDPADALAPEALPRMYALAVRHGCDIVLGKTGDARESARVFMRTVERCTVDDFPLVECVTAHQLFRRSFLLDNDLWFATDGHELVDELFMVRAYLAAKSVSVLADYACRLPAPAERTAADPSSRPRLPVLSAFGAGLRAVFDAVDAGTEPGALRAQLTRRFLREEMLSWLREPRLLRCPETYRTALVRLLRDVALERRDGGMLASADVMAPLPVLTRLRARLLERDRLDGLIELARRCEHVRAAAVVDDLRWQGAALHADVRTSLAHRDGSPVVVVEREGRFLLDPRLGDGLPTIPTVDVGDPCAAVEAAARVHHRDADVSWWAPATLRPTLVPVGSGRQAHYHVVVSGTVVLDPRTLAGGGPLEPGRHELWVEVDILGLRRTSRLTVEQGARWESALVPAVVGNPARIIVPRRSVPRSQLVLDVDERHQTLAGEVAARGIGPLQARGAQVQVMVPVQSTPGAGTRAVEVVIGRAGSARTLPGRIQPAHEAVLAFNDVTTLPPGRHPLALRTDPSGRRPAVPIGTALVRGGRIVAVRGISYRALPRRLVARVVADPRVHRGATRVLSALPPEAGEWARRVVSRLARWSSRQGG